MLIIGLMVAHCFKSRSVEDEPVFVDELAPVIYFNPDDPAIGHRPKKFKPEKKIMEPEFYEALKKRKNIEQEMKAVLYDFFTYAVYVAIIFIIMFADRDRNAYLEKAALETAIVHGGTNCDVLPDDDPNFKACDPEAVPDPWINFMKVIP